MVQNECQPLKWHTLEFHLSRHGSHYSVEHMMELWLGGDEDEYCSLFAGIICELMGLQESIIGPT